VAQGDTSRRSLSLAKPPTKNHELKDDVLPTNFKKYAKRVHGTKEIIDPLLKMKTDIKEKRNSNLIAPSDLKTPPVPSELKKPPEIEEDPHAFPEKANDSISDIEDFKIAAKNNLYPQ